MVTNVKWGGAFIFAATVAFGCNAVLGIDEAKLDPSLADAGGIISTNEATLSCESYCSVIGQNCKDVDLEYVSEKACLEMCRQFDTGRIGDQQGDNLACRVYHTNAAATNPKTHCRHAGPLGGGHCGEQPCNSFCLLAFAICGDRPPYPSEAECRTTCKTYPYETVGANVGDLTIADGTSLNCRVYHLESAVENPGTHCSHTSLNNIHCTPPGATDAGSDAAGGH